MVLIDPIKKAVRKYNPNYKEKEDLDRFIPNREASNFDYAKTVLRGGWERKETPGSPAKEAYRKRLKEVFNMENPRIFVYKNKPQVSVDLCPPGYYYDSDESGLGRPNVKPARQIRQFPDWILDAPDILDDAHLNLLDWGRNDVLAVALDCTVYLWNACDGSAEVLVTVPDELGPVTSVSWSPDGSHVALGLMDSGVQLWDSSTGRLVRTFEGGYQGCVGSLAWNGCNILTSGSDRGSICNNDVRARGRPVDTYRGHKGRICGLKWSPSGCHLASGGDDNLVYLWDRSLSSLNDSSFLRTNQWLHRLQGHRAATRALAWCPFQNNLLATGGDECIKFWNTHTGSCLNSVNTGSEVCSLLWSSNDRELLSSHGHPDNQLILWKYPSMVKMAQLFSHTSRALFMASSPDGCTVASAAGDRDETMRLWKVFRATETPKQVPTDLFATVSRITRIR